MKNQNLNHESENLFVATAVEAEPQALHYTQANDDNMMIQESETVNENNGFSSKNILLLGIAVLVFSIGVLLLFSWHDQILKKNLQ